VKSLNKYKSLSNEEKSYINSFVSFNSIFNKTNESEIELPEDDIVLIKNIVLNVYEKDDSYGYSVSDITDFIINNYLDEDITLEDIKSCPTDRVLQAIYCNNGYLMKSKNKDEKDIMELD